VLVTNILKNGSKLNTSKMSETPVIEDLKKLVPSRFKAPMSI